MSYSRMSVSTKCITTARLWYSDFGTWKSLLDIQSCFLTFKERKRLLQLSSATVVQRFSGEVIGRSQAIAVSSDVAYGFAQKPPAAITFGLALGHVGRD